MSGSFNLQKAEKAYEMLLSCLPLTEEGVDRTPLRAAKAFGDLTKGYHSNIKSVVGEGIFPYTGNGIVHVKGLEICSMCEHHLLPFIGSCSITYIPDKKILGLSKLKRIADLFARRLQVQERLTDQIADAINESVHPKGVMVVIRSAHMCMKMRGVTESDSETSTVSYRGAFLKDENLRQQYYSDSYSRPRI